MGERQQAETPTTPPGSIYRYSVLLLFGLGLFLRARHYLGDRSMWIDEAQLALNFLHPHVWSLFHPLLYDQMAPVGFLLIEKLAASTFGTGEYSLRLYPFVAGILSVFLIYKLALKLFGPRMALIALTLFSVSHWPIYYSAEFKQYSSDIAVALLLYLVASHTVENFNFRRWLSLTVAGIVGVWLSHPAAFILAGIGISIGIHFIQSRQWRELSATALSSALWLSSFLFGLYATSAFDSGTLSDMTKLFWSAAFAPFPPTSFSDFHWYYASLIQMFTDPLGFDLRGFAVFLFLAGMLSLWRSNRLWLGMFTVPLLVTLAASALDLYPFSTRLLTFLVPGMIIVIVAGLETIRQMASGGYQSVSVLAVVLLLFQPVTSALSHASHKAPYELEDIKGILKPVSKSMVAGDRIYIYYGAGMAFRYYQPRYHIPLDTVIWGHSPRKSWSDYLADVRTMQHFKRVWVVFSHVGVKGAGMDEERFLLYFLDQHGTRLASINKKGASGYLYRFDAAGTPH